MRSQRNHRTASRSRHQPIRYQTSRSQASRCGSTSVACCPGGIVYGSELICVRLEDEISGGVEGEEEDDPEHPASASIDARTRAGITLQSNFSTLSVMPIFADYFALFFAARREGGITPFSGLSFSILSESLCSGLSPAEDRIAPSVGTVNPCAVYIASL